MKNLNGWIRIILIKEGKFYHMGKFWNKLGEALFKGMMHSAGVESLNPYIGLLLKADTKDLIADEKFRLGMVYGYGQYGVLQDRIKAKEYFRMAAEEGHPPAMVMYLQCLMTKPDEHSPEILKWLTKASELGEKQALYNLGISYHRGDVPGVDPIKDSLTLFRKSAELGYSSSYSRMACIYHEGEGVDQNDTIAKYWAWLDFANSQTQEQRNHSIFNILIKPSDLFEGNIVNFKKIIEEAAEAGEPDAMNNWGTGIYPEDPKKGIELQQRAIEMGHKIAACNMGKHLWTEEVKDYDNAFKLFQTSADWGCAEAQYSLAVMFGEGLGVTKDIPQAWKWLEKSINMGCDDARRYFAHLIMTNQMLEILPDKVMRGPSYMELAHSQL